jgi:hypothetical protein
MLWTLPAFLAIWTAVGADMYAHGDFETEEKTIQTTELSETTTIAENKAVSEEK